MYVQTPHQTDFAFDKVAAPAQKHSVIRHGFMETRGGAQRFTRSVVEEAGLGRFVYIRGASGKRYVFSAIEPEQTFLYEKAIFAMTDMSGECVSFSSSAVDRQAHALQLGCVVYVHLLGEDEGGDEFVLEDLSSSKH